MDKGEKWPQRDILAKGDQMYLVTPPEQLTSGGDEKGTVVEAELIRIPLIGRTTRDQTAAGGTSNGSDLLRKRRLLLKKERNGTFGPDHQIGAIACRERRS
jgi:hypothetical protein